MAASGQIGEPVFATVQDAEGRVLTVRGVPGAWTSLESPGEGIRLPEGWVWLPEEHAFKPVAGELHFLPRAAVSSLQVVQRLASGEESPVGQAVDFGEVGIREARTIRFRVKNAGVAALLVDKLALSGSWYRIVDSFSPPRTLAPGGFADFSVRFEPEAAGEFKAKVQVNELLFEVKGAAGRISTVEAESLSGWESLSELEPFSVGAVASGRTLERKFRVRYPVGVPSPAPPRVQGASFSLSGSDEGFVVAFTPQAPGDFAGTLEAGGRKFSLTAEGLAFTPPQPALQSSVPIIESGMQVKFAVRLSEPSLGKATGKLQVLFTPERTDLPDDASIVFVPSCVRSAAFTVQPDAKEADFDGANEVSLQTGSVAGWITVRASLGAFVDELKFHVEPGAVKLSSAAARRATGVAEVVLKGLDNTRTAGKIAFKFYLLDGTVAAPGRIEADASGFFRDYFSTTPQAGGTFSLRAQFPVSGTATELDSVEIELANDKAVTRVEKLKFE
jgi:hypothetical protein